MNISYYLNNLRDFEPWSGAKDTWETIVNAGLGERFMEELECLGKENITETELNDLLWFEPEYCFELIGLKVENENEI